MSNDNTITITELLMKTATIFGKIDHIQDNKGTKLFRGASVEHLLNEAIHEIESYRSIIKSFSDAAKILDNQRKLPT